MGRLFLFYKNPRHAIMHVMKKFDENDLVSVIVPCFNNNDTVKQAVESALGQRGVETEIILIDDGMTLQRHIFPEDHTGMRLRILSLPENIGPSGARNYGVRAAKGKYIAFLDADDWWDPDKLSMQLTVFSKLREGGEAPSIVFSGRDIYDKDGSPSGRYIGCPRIVDYKRLLETNYINCSSAVLPKSIAAAHPMGSDNIHEDYLCWLEILKEGGYAAGINRPLLHYRYDNNSKSGNKIRSAFMTYGVYKEIGLSTKERLHYMRSYAARGVRKYYG